jgi:hypothetical protein
MPRSEGEHAQRVFAPACPSRNPTLSGGVNWRAHPSQRAGHIFCSSSVRCSAAFSIVTVTDPGVPSGAGSANPT